MSLLCLLLRQSVILNLAITRTTKLKFQDFPDSVVHYLIARPAALRQKYVTTMEKPLKRKLLWSVMLAFMVFLCLVVYSAIQAPGQLREAYAAWDTGTLLVEYLKAHDNQWPKSWDDLLTVMDGKTPSDFRLRGRGDGMDKEYAVSLREKVLVDWNFNPKTRRPDRPVTRLDGKPFPVTWQDAEPNKMIHDHLDSTAQSLKD
jgi:hypothetical protein